MRPFGVSGIIFGAGLMGGLGLLFRLQPSKFRPPKPRFASEEDRPRMVRRGKTGATGEVRSPDQQVATDRRCLAELEQLGSTLPYVARFELTNEEAKTG